MPSLSVCSSSPYVHHTHYPISSVQRPTYGKNAKMNRCQLQIRCKSSHTSTPHYHPIIELVFLHQTEREWARERTGGTAIMKTIPISLLTYFSSLLDNILCWRRKKIHCSSKVCSGRYLVFLIQLLLRQDPKHTSCSPQHTLVLHFCLPEVMQELVLACVTSQVKWHHTGVFSVF